MDEFVSITYCTAAELVVASRRRRQQLQMLALVGRRDEALGATVVDHGTAAAYCLPGRRRRIVLTTAALQALDTDQLRAVVAHEQAHLRGRHHLVAAGARALARAFPWVPAFRYAAGDVERLVEMLADDAATRRCDRWTVATALVALAEGSAPRAALAAGGPTALARSGDWSARQRRSASLAGQRSSSSPRLRSSPRSR